MINHKRRPDIAIALILTVLFFFLYAQFGLRLAQGVYFDYLNLAFDFDPPYFIDFLVGSLPSGVNYKQSCWCGVFLCWASVQSLSQ